MATSPTRSPGFRLGARKRPTFTVTGPPGVAVTLILPPPARLPGGQLFCCACAFEQRLGTGRPSYLRHFSTLSTTKLGTLSRFGGVASIVATVPAPAVFGLKVSFADPAASATAANASGARTNRRATFRNIGTEI